MGDGPEADDDVCSSEIEPLPMMTWAKMGAFPSSSSSSSSASFPPPKLPALDTEAEAELDAELLKKLPPPEA